MQGSHPAIKSFRPVSESLIDVAVPSCVADACDLYPRGAGARDQFGAVAKLQAPFKVSSNNRPEAASFYWNGSIHPLTAYWIPHMMEWAGAVGWQALTTTRRQTVGQSQSRPGKTGRDFVDRRGRGRHGCLLVACCGFGLDRNIRDTDSYVEDTPHEQHKGKCLAMVTPFANRINLALVASYGVCAYDDQPLVMIKTIRALPFVSKDLVGWQGGLEEKQMGRNHINSDMETSRRHTITLTGKVTYVDRGGL
jgi:hypothetical protein